MENEIKVESGVCEKLPTENEWFIPLVNWSNCGDMWTALCLARSLSEAENTIRCSGDAKYARIVRVVLPSGEIA